MIGYEETEVLGIQPAVYFVRVIKREKRACAARVTQGVATASVPERIAPKSIFADEAAQSYRMGCRIGKEINAFIARKKQVSSCVEGGLGAAPTTARYGIVTKNSESRILPGHSKERRTF